MKFTVIAVWMLLCGCALVAEEISDRCRALLREDVSKDLVQKISRIEYALDREALSEATDGMLEFENRIRDHDKKELRDTRLELEFVALLAESKNDQVVILYARNYLIRTVDSLKLQIAFMEANIRDQESEELRSAIDEAKARLECYQSLLIAVELSLEQVDGANGVKLALYS